MPQRSWLGPFTFLGLIGDLQLDCFTSMLASADRESHMQHAENLRTHSQANKMIINQNKSQEMVLCSLAKQPIPCLPRDALLHSAVLRLHVVRLSVRPSVCL